MSKFQVGERVNMNPQASEGDWYLNYSEGTVTQVTREGWYVVMWDKFNSLENFTGSYPPSYLLSAERKEPKFIKDKTYEGLFE